MNKVWYAVVRVLLVRIAVLLLCDFRGGQSRPPHVVLDLWVVFGAACP